MLGKLLGKAIAEVVLAPMEAIEEVVAQATEECSCRKHKWDPDCPRHGNH